MTLCDTHMLLDSRESVAICYPRSRRKDWLTEIEKNKQREKDF
jgi:hypothetical protein